MKQGPPDLKIGGTLFRTCNPDAFVVQKDLVGPIDDPPAPEEELVKRIERHHAVKDAKDPMPPFESVGQKLIDLSEMKMHPLYMK